MLGQITVPPTLPIASLLHPIYIWNTNEQFILKSASIIKHPGRRRGASFHSPLRWITHELFLLLPLSFFSLISSEQEISIRNSASTFCSVTPSAKLCLKYSRVDSANLVTLFCDQVSSSPPTPLRPKQRRWTPKASPSPVPRPTSRSPPTSSCPGCPSAVKPKAMVFFP